VRTSGFKQDNINRIIYNIKQGRFVFVVFFLLLLLLLLLRSSQVTRAVNLRARYAS